MPLRVRAAAAVAVAVAALIAGCGRPEPPPAAAVEPLAAGRAIDPPAAAGSLAPELALAGGAVLLSWLEPVPPDGHRLRVARLGAGGWDEPVTVAEGERFFANWADLPAVVEAGDGSLVAHWLVRTGEPVYAYSVFLARSADGGASWSPLGRLNDDDTPTEHGFVSWVAEDTGARAFWLDGRATAEDGPMSLRTARIGETIGPAEVLDARVCDCCSTDAAAGAAGPLVVYRDRGDTEVRDVALVRRSGDGWSAPEVPVADGWEIAGCPVNGPEVEAAGQEVALAWFTAEAGAPRVQLAFSADGGAGFEEAIVIDAASPLGRVDLALDGAGGAVVVWLAAAGERGSVRLRRAFPGGRTGEPVEVAVTGAERAAGFPRILRLGEKLYLAWVDTSPEDGARIRAREIPLAALDAPV